MVEIYNHVGESAVEEARRLAAHRRYLAGLRISYGNAISACNMRLQLQVHPPHNAVQELGGNNGGKLRVKKQCPSATFISPYSTLRTGSTSNAYSWQLNSSSWPRPVSPVLPKLVKKNTVPPIPFLIVRDSNIRQYEELQKQALALAQAQIENEDNALL